MALHEQFVDECTLNVYALGVPSVYPNVKPRDGPCIKHSSRPQVEAYRACRGRGWPEARDMHARKCPDAGGRGACTCMHV
eukprot:364418-Chlamydomonas_euryale.AAC.21